MSVWRGLHNHAKHTLPDRDDGAVCPCLPEGEWCWRESPCRCCLASEVERLTERVRVLEVERDKWQARADLPLRERDWLRTKVDRLTGRIEAAQAVCEQAVKHRTAANEMAYGLDYLNGWNDALDIVEQALRGES